MKHTTTFTALEDDNRFEGHEFELVFDDEFESGSGKGYAFDNIRSVGCNPISTEAAAFLIGSCLLADEIVDAINDSSYRAFVTRSDVEDVCNKVDGLNGEFIVLTSDYSSLEVAA